MSDRKKTKAELVTELSKARRRLSRLEGFHDQFKEIKWKLREQTVEYEKLSALGRLTANVAHEIRNPVTVIGGLARRMNRSVPSGTKEKEYVKLIMLEARRLEDILRDVITFSDKGIFERSECDINEVVQESLDMYINRCTDRCVFIQKSLSDAPQVFIDRKQVGEAFHNLIMNAIDAMPDGGTLSVKSEKKVFSRKNYVVVHISDTGVGIREDKMKLLFEPFFTTKMNRQETGLGLPIAKKIVEAHGGFIKVKSKINKGTIFSLYIPYRTPSKKRS
jgi:signal transduction histidine kinase